MGNTSSTRFDDIPYLKRINDIFSTIVAVLLLLAVIIYAGERGYYAYHHLPARQSNFKVLKPVNFPAVTACPLEPYNVVPTDCIKETALSPYPTGFCLDYVYQRAHVFEGFNYTHATPSTIQIPRKVNRCNQILFRTYWSSACSSTQV